MKKAMQGSVFGGFDEVKVSVSGEVRATG